MRRNHLITYDLYKNRTLKVHVYQKVDMRAWAQIHSVYNINMFYKVVKEGNIYYRPFHIFLFILNKARQICNTNGSLTVHLQWQKIDVTAWSKRLAYEWHDHYTGYSNRSYKISARAIYFGLATVRLNLTAVVAVSECLDIFPGQDTGCIHVSRTGVLL